MKFTKNKFIAGVIIIAVLLVAYFGTGPIGSLKKATETAASQPTASITAELTPDTQADGSVASGDTPSQSEPPTDQPSEEAEPSKSPDPINSPEPSPTPKPSDKAKDTPETTNKPSVKPDSQKSPSPAPSMSIDPDTGQDHYLTDPVPSGKPLPEEPQDAVITDKQMTAYLTVSAATILDNLDKLDPEKLELVPKDGIIFAKQKVAFYEGESVFNVLQREMKKHKIHMEFENTPMYNSAYIEGINNLYEFDCGELSGWMYKVNGWFPNYGSSRYKLKQGDVIEWVYTCDLGRDVGDAYNAAGSDAS
ncbi:DUF4430 domain-containing protein [Paenibacillus glycanilyticus]|uniref:Transcobalamin-like C-terminal domain-containing protein n=1 Tax=Paenibacillus glycanilyticus TaxID=126569 RepID=A0ABQ6GAV0_9BACL|nr:DUF4430 domain-containing protein [Paenibacillus glycanilyticus]GLX68069.1 hypothetical protein MU1_24140 [Paenibacillus glycanilyticus]